MATIVECHKDCLAALAALETAKQEHDGVLQQFVSDPDSPWNQAALAAAEDGVLSASRKLSEAQQALNAAREERLAQLPK